MNNGDIIYRQKKKWDYNKAVSTLVWDKRDWETEEEPLTGTEAICSTFGCGKTLTLRETLFGSKCVSCK